MVKRLSLVLTLAAVGALVTGCGSVTVTRQLNGQKLTSDTATPIAHVNGSTWGLYFLPMFPLITGDAVTGKTVFINDTVTLDNAVNAVTAKSKSLGATATTDLVSSQSSIWIPIPPLFFTWIKSVEVSGNAVKAPAK